jgi:hypothetical protein
MTRKQPSYAASFEMSDLCWTTIQPHVAEWESDAHKCENKGRPRCLSTRMLVNSIFSNVRLQVPWSELDRRKQGGSRAAQLAKWLRARKSYQHVLSLLIIDHSSAASAVAMLGDSVTAKCQQVTEGAASCR